MARGRGSSREQAELENRYHRSRHIETSAELQLRVRPARQTVGVHRFHLPPSPGHPCHPPPGSWCAGAYRGRAHRRRSRRPPPELCQAEAQDDGQQFDFGRYQRTNCWIPREMTGWIQIEFTFALRSKPPYAKRLKLLVWKGGRVV